MPSKMLNYLLGTTSKVEILRVLYESDDAMTGRRIAATAGISPRSCQLSLDSLVKNKAIYRKAIGRAYSYTLNREHRMVWELMQPLFEQERSLHKEVAASLAKLVKTLNDEAVAVFWRLHQERKSESIQLLVVVEEKKRALDREVLHRLEEEIERRYGFSTKVDLIARADFVPKFLAGDAARKHFQRDYGKLRGLSLAELG